MLFFMAVLLTPGKSLPKGQVSQYESSRPGTSKSESSFENVKRARKQELIRAAAEGKLTSSQEEELRSQGITVTPNPSGEGYIVTEPSKPEYGPRERIDKNVSVRTQDRPSYEYQQKIVAERNKELLEESVEAKAQPSETDINKGSSEISTSPSTGGFPSASPEMFFAPTRKASTHETISVQEEYNPVWELKQKLNPEVLHGETAYGSPVPVPYLSPAYFEERAEEIEYKNIQSKSSGDLKTNLLINPVGVVAGSFFVGAVIKPAISVYKMGYTHGKEGLVAETFATAKFAVTDPVGFGIETGKSFVSNPAEFAGSVVAYKYIFESINPIKSVVVEKVKVPELSSNLPSRTNVKPSVEVRGTEGMILKEPNVVKGEINTKFVESENTIVKGVTVETKVPGIIYRSGVIVNNVNYGLSGRKSFLRIVNPAYSNYLRANLLYADLMRTEIIIPPAGSVETTTKREIVSLPGGGKAIRTTEVTTPSQPSREIDISASGLEDNPFYKGKKWDPVLNRFVRTEGKNTFKDRFSSESAESLQGDITTSGGGGGQASSLLQETVGRPKKYRLVTSEEVPVVIKPFREKLSSAVFRPVVSIVPVNNISRVSLSNKINVVQSNKLASGVVGVQKPLVDQKQSNVLSQSNILSQSSSNVQSQSVVQSQSQSQVRVQSQKQVQSQVQSLKQSLMSESVTSKFVLPDFRFKSPNEKGVFSVEVRRRGKFEVVASNVPLGKAFSIGKSEIANTAAASYRVVPLTSQASSELKANFGRGLGKGLYFSKRESGVIIEKPSMRIKSSGEKYEIPGAAARKRKRRSGLL